MKLLSVGLEQTMARFAGDNNQVDPDRWVDTYADSLYSYALFRVRDRFKAEELVQETFTAALGARTRFRGDSSERTWFFSILKNKIVDQIRQKYRDNTRSVDILPEAPHEDFFDQRGEWLSKPQKWRDNPQQNYEQREFVGVVRKCLSRLPSNQGDAFIMREFDDISRDEICKVLHISPTNYWVLLHRARLKIRECLERNWFNNSAADEGSNEDVDV
ncbi:MAG: sigma-70 family RNA polymerase sigma factor [Desulforhopalus sp.]